MGVLWRPQGRSRERVLAYGSTGVGKTYAALTIINKALGDEDVAYIVDADNTWSRTLETDGEELGVKVREEWFWVGSGKTGRWERDATWENEDGNVILYHTDGWEQHADALGRCLSSARADDWLVVDSMTWLWDSVLPWYIARTHGTELPDFLIEHRVRQVAEKAKETQGQDAVLVEWNYINPLWNKKVATPLVNSRCHLWLTAEAKPMRTDGRVDNQVRQLYESVGMIPSSQKRLGHQMQTVLLFGVSKTGEYQVTTVKDRGREKLEKVEWDDMFSVYLRKTAKWKPTK